MDEHAFLFGCNQIYRRLSNLDLNGVLFVELEDKGRTIKINGCFVDNTSGIYKKELKKEIKLMC